MRVEKEAPWFFVLFNLQGLIYTRLCYCPVGSGTLACTPASHNSCDVTFQQIMKLVYVLYLYGGSKMFKVENVKVCKCQGSMVQVWHKLMHFQGD